MFENFEKSEKSVILSPMVSFWLKLSKSLGQKICCPKLSKWSILHSKHEIVFRVVFMKIDPFLEAVPNFKRWVDGSGFVRKHQKHAQTSYLEE